MGRSGKGRGHRGAGAAPRPEPERTCCGCREADGRDALVRLVDGPDGALLVDLRGSRDGRGAWVHPRSACVAAVEARPGSLTRSLHATPAAVGLHEQLCAQLLAAALEGLSMAAAGGALVGGRDFLLPALRDARLAAVVVASGASARTVDEYRTAAPPEVVFLTVPLDAEALGARVGKGPRAVLGVRAASASAHLLRQLRRLRDLGYTSPAP